MEKEKHKKEKRFASQLAWIIALFFLLFFGTIIAAKVFAFAGFLANNWDQYKHTVYDWPDTVAMTDMLKQGKFFTGDSQFIDGNAIFGLFPPALSIVLAFIDIITGDTFNSILFLSIALQIAITYLIARDWPGKLQIVLLILLLNFNPMVLHYFPIAVRVRELLAVLFLVLLYKNPFKLDERVNYLVFGALLAITQPIVAIIGIASYPIVKADFSLKKADTSLLKIAALLAIIFFITYHQHFLIKFENAFDTNSLRCIDTLISTGAQPFYLFMFYLVPVPFFFFFCGNKKIRLLWIALSLAGLGLLLLQSYPSLFLQILSPIKEDLCVHLLYSVFAFFALFPPKNKPRGDYLLIISVLVAMQLLFSSVAALPTSENFNDLTVSIPSLQKGAKILSISVFYWDSNKMPLFNGFDMAYISNIYLLNKGPKIYYSPMQQYYDTQNIVPDAMGLFSSITNGNISACRERASVLSKRADYLYSSFSYSSFSPNSWSVKQVSELSNSSFLEKCGISLEESLNYSYILYKFEKE